MPVKKQDGYVNIREKHVTYPLNHVIKTECMWYNNRLTPTINGVRVQDQEIGDESLEVFPSGGLQWIKVCALPL